MAGNGLRTALVVEDDPIIRSLLEWQLDVLGFRVTAVESVCAARGALARSSFTLLALDDALPDGRAEDVLAALPSPAPWVLMCSGRRSPPALPVDAFIAKPFSFDDLRAALAEPALWRR